MDLSPGTSTVPRRRAAGATVKDSMLERGAADLPSADDVPFLNLRLGLLRQEVRRRHVLVDALHLHLADHPVGAEDFQELAGLEAVLLPEADDDEVEFPVNHQDGPGG